MVMRNLLTTRQLAIQPSIRAFVAAIACCLMFSSAAQQDLLEDRWFTLSTPNFTFFSQVSSRQTRRVANELEMWRQVAAFNISGELNFATANVSNIVYLFKDEKSFTHFTAFEELALFYPTPRYNFMAFMPSLDSSQSAALHQYAHFLEKNFADLRLPRWYEEGLAAYLARVAITRGKAEFSEPIQNSNQVLAKVNHLLAMDKLFYRDEALASPRMIQIANLKSEALLYYFLHAYEEPEFIDRRDELSNYLALLLEGRNPRYAFDQSFSVTTAQLDEEFEYYLLTTSNQAGLVRVADLTQLENLEPQHVDEMELGLMMGELALNAGKTEGAELFFQTVIDAGSPAPRAYSGLGDALRYQELEGRDQEIARYFELALESGPNDLGIMLDYGEYWEAELENCEKSYPFGQRQSILAAMKAQLERAVALSPNSAEANLAMAEFYLLEGQDWTLGREYQSKAFDLLPADGFIMEQTIKYSIAAKDFDEAQRLITELAQPLHYFGEPGYVTDLRENLLRKRRGESYDACSE